MSNKVTSPTHSQVDTQLKQYPNIERHRSMEFGQEIDMVETQMKKEPLSSHMKSS
jgi:hypothetical protein